MNKITYAFLRRSALAVFTVTIGLSLCAQEEFRVEEDMSSGYTEEVVTETTDQSVVETQAAEPEVAAEVVPATVIEQKAVAPETKAKRGFFGSLFGKKEATTPVVADETDEEINQILEEVKDDIRMASEGEGTLEQQIIQAEVEASEDGSIEEVIKVQEEVRRQAKEIEAYKNFEEANELMRQGKYEEALKKFEVGIEALPKRPATVALRDNIRKSQADCEYNVALRMYNAKHYNRAIDATKRALKFYPAHKGSANFLKRSERLYDKQKVDLAKAQPPWKDPDRVKKVDSVAGFIKKGRQYIAIKEWEKAREQFYEALRMDPKNSEATAHLREIAQKEYEINTKEMETTRVEMMAQVRDRWSPPVPQKDVGYGGMSKATSTSGIDMSPARAELMKKLNEIVIPELNFRDANIVDVVDFLVNASMETDPSPTRKGVNILLQRKPGASSSVSSSSSSDDLFLFDEPSSSASPVTDAPSITMSLRNMLLIDAIRYITDFSQMKYRIEEHAVIIYPADMAIGRIVTRVYSVQPSITEVIFAAGEGGGDTSDPFGGVDFGSGTTPQRQDVKKFFVDAGVPFPDGTSIVYKPSISKLFVSNTAENLEKFEDILRMLDQVPKQVKIEARYVEIGQNDIEELGVQWMLTDNWEIMQKAGAGAGIPVGSRELIQVNQNQFTRGLRYMTGGDIPTASAGGNMGGLFSISSVLTNPEMTFVLHALDQKEGVNLLSAPSITTKSGMNAQIKIVKELIYPTEYTRDITVLGSGDAQTQHVIITPTSFETKDVGVILNVTPTVGPDGVTIDLAMIPQVVELTEWLNYGSYDPRTGVTENMMQPVFHLREIITSISIWDGQTVVMGGLIDEKLSTTEDKIPFLGDLPLIGALFRSKTSVSQKKNLMIFVTATLVDPAGNLINKPGATADIEAMMATP
ncbi:MAG: hypothetical protein GX811_10120 [Lentisphaerae bacterium]|nr:hypothetical protein [Lentisphaerota bacterium]